MSDPRPADEVPFAEAPLWNAKALRQEFVRYIREQLSNSIEIDRSDARELVREYRWALEKLLVEGVIEEVRRQGQRFTYRVRA